MNMPLEKFKQNILKIKDTATERSYYKDICNFLEEFSENVKMPAVNATPEESSTVIKRGIGFPDITVRQNERLIGWIEVKLPKDNLKSEKFEQQFTKYKDSLENILFTNLREWQLWQWDDKGRPIKETEIIFDIFDFAVGEEEKFFVLLHKFFEGRPYEARSPKQLAFALAKKTKMLSKQVEEAMEESGEEEDLPKLKNIFEKTLIQNLSIHQFSNLVAETMAYSLFLAFLEHDRRGKLNEQLNLTTAIEYLPMNVPILADLYLLISKVSGDIPNIKKSLVALVEQLKSADIGKINHKLIEHKPGEDPVIQFYEPFLKEYDPKEREARGVYYTPKPVVDYIVRSADWLLREKFGKEKGLADESVHLLDPAAGTGTFLMSAIQEIYANIRKNSASLGEEMVKKEFNNIVLSHILKHFYGFELLAAPYAIAHLKLALLLEDLGFNFAMAKNDKDKDNDRFKIYLANTLDDPNKPPQLDLPGYHIADETNKANEVKLTKPVIAIIGNPPYSNFGRMNREDWILRLLDDYKKGLNERKINLDDDFIKFIRFAQWKIEQVGQGIFAMITSNTFIDGITHRQMRKCLMDTFDEIYIYNLHGNLRKKEKCPDGSKDENVFNIQQGVSINIFVKYPEKKEKTIVKYCDLWGRKKDKFDILLQENFTSTNWKTLNPKDLNWFFVEKDERVEEEYKSYKSITEVFKNYSSGIITRNDDIAIQFEKETIKGIVKDFINLDLDRIREKYKIIDGASWKLEKAKHDLISNREVNKISKILYRPFDSRYTVFTKKSGGFLNRPIYETMRNFNMNNIGFILARQQPLVGFHHVFISNSITDIHSISDQNYIHPLYLYSDKKSNQSSFLNTDVERKANLSDEFIKEFSGKLNLDFVADGRGDLKKTFGPEDVFYYAYAVFHSPTYRARYAEQLKIDFPRLPLTRDRELFKKLAGKGNELVNLHLLGENPFDKEKTIFDEPEKWGVKIGGEKDENIDDWKVKEVIYNDENNRVYVNSKQYFEGIEKDVWEFMIGGYQVCEKWLKDRKKAERCLSLDDLKHYMKIVVSLRETIRIMKEIDALIPKWPME